MVGETCDSLTGRKLKVESRMPLGLPFVAGEDRMPFVDMEMQSPEESKLQWVLCSPSQSLVP